MGKNSDLKNILDHNVDIDSLKSKFEQTQQTEKTTDPSQTFCVECSDQLAELFCKDCDEPFCKLEAEQVDFNNFGSIVNSKNENEFSQWIISRAKSIPLRLTQNERKYMRLLEATLNVSEYTDKIDILLYGNKLASDYKAGQALFEDRQFEDNSVIFQRIFEIGRRYKIMNPQKMRNTY
ncbi:hypothetical protein BB560_005980, partial [Smittium megazygosporum]